MRVRTAIVLGLVLALVPTAPLAAAPGAGASATSNVEAKLRSASEAIDELRLEDAAREIAEVEQSHPELPALLMLRAQLLFHQGDYANAVAFADRALSAVAPHQADDWQETREVMAQTAEVMRDFEHKTSPDGRYVVSFPKGKDALFVDYALDVLAQADRALQRVFASTLPAPIRLEIYDSPETLAMVSALTVEQIKTTGTVALSKWNRLMVTSPKALVRGYPWADTITHELVHMVVSRLTQDRAPVWLQEGTAKLFERAWRAGQPELKLDPGAKALLHKAASKKKLLTFEQMHPSIAMLPSEEDAALAFAQVATFMQGYVARYGEQGLRTALASIRDGMDARKALGQAAALPFAELERDWKKSLPTAPENEKPLLRLRKRFAVAGGQDHDESTEVVLDVARRHMRIGDLLWDRGRIGGATQEYAKAQRADPQDPIVATRWARAALRADNPKAVVEALAPHVERFPGHAPTYALLGAAHLRLGARPAASNALREAIWINPFDPQPHCDLAKASDDPAEVARETERCSALR